MCKCVFRHTMLPKKGNDELPGMVREPAQHWMCDTAAQDDADEYTGVPFYTRDRPL